MNERKASLKAKLEAELAAAADDDELTALRDRFSAEERALEHQVSTPTPLPRLHYPDLITRPDSDQVDHEVHTFSATIDLA